MPYVKNQRNSESNKCKKFRLSDMITTIRIILTIILTIELLFFYSFVSIWFNVFFIIFIIFLDSVDGFVARKIDKDQFVKGGFYDILGDRIVELLFQVPFVYYHILNPLVLIYYIVKDFIVDFVRYTNHLDHSKKAPFDQVKFPLSKFLVKSKFMRTIYAIMKLVMFLSLTFSLYHYLDPQISNIIAWITVAISLLRSLPPFAENFFSSK